MGFAFTTRTDAAGQVRRIALEQVEKALEDAEEMADGFDATVHRIRRRCKRLRGLLRLIRPVFDGYSRENATIRDAAAELSGSRDAKVVLDTFDALLADGALSLSVENREAVRALLQPPEGAVSEQHGRAMLDDFTARMRPLRDRIADWDLGGNGFGLIEDGLEATYRTLREDFATASRSEDAEDLHECRKAVKYHWHHVTLLEKSAPNILSAQRDALGKLGEHLGDHHNLAVLAERLDSGDSSVDKAVVQSVHAAVTKRQHDLAEAARELGAQLTAERAGAVRDRFAAYWRLLPER
jgi:CHAD domain-containing protein